MIENAGTGMQLLQDLQRDVPFGIPRPIGRKPDGSKQDRMVAQSAWIEAGHVHLPTQSDWLDVFLLEFLAFPNGRHDDQVDSVSQFLKWAAVRRFRQSPCTAPTCFISVTCPEHYPVLVALARRAPPYIGTPSILETAREAH